MIEDLKHAKTLLYVQGMLTPRERDRVDRRIAELEREERLQVSEEEYRIEERERRQVEEVRKVRRLFP
jgi:uncharacterized protein YpbB